MPDWKPEILRRLAPLKLTPAREAEIAEEIAQHLEDRYQELLATGQSEDAAFRTVIDELKGEDFLARSLRPVERDLYREPVALGKGSSTFFSGVLQDIRHALRMLRKSPGFTAIAVLTLALGIGANTAIFSVVNGVLLNPLPYPQPNQLVEVAELNPPFHEGSISYPNFLDWVQQNHTFQSLAGYRQNDFSLTGVGEPQRVKVGQVSASFFPILDVKPVAGRNFTATEDKRGAAPTVMLSEALWKTKFGGSRDIVGKMITLDGTGYTVVGVVPSNFYFCCASTNFHLDDVYTPIGQWRQDFFTNVKLTGASSR